MTVKFVLTIELNTLDMHTHSDIAAALRDCAIRLDQGGIVEAYAGAGGVFRKERGGRLVGEWDVNVYYE